MMEEIHIVTTRDKKRDNKKKWLTIEIYQKYVMEMEWKYQGTAMSD